MGLNPAPWQEEAFKLAGGQPQGQFTNVGDLGDNAGTGAARELGEMGGFPVGQVDVRTPTMRALEMASLPVLIQSLTNPQGISQMFSQMAGPVPGAQQSSLANFLFNDAGAFTGGAGGGQGGGSTGGGAGGGAGGQGGQPSGPPVAGGPLQGLPIGSPIPAPQGSTPGQPAPIDEAGNIIPNHPAGQPAANMPLYQRIQQMAMQLGQGASPSYSTPFSTQNQTLQQLLTSIGAGYQGQDALVGGAPTMGTAQSLLGELLNYSPALRGYNFDAPQTLGLAGDLWSGLDPYSKSRSLENVASIAAGGGSFPTIEQFLQSIGIQTRANGGPLDPMAPTLVGENGPELITPTGLNGVQNVVPLTGAGAPQNAFAQSPVQGQGTGSIQRLLEQNPEMEAFNASKNILMGQGGLLNAGGGGQGVVNAMRPVFEQNLQFGLNALTNAVPSVRNSGAAIQGADLSSRALNDFNLLAAQALQQGQQNTLGGLGVLGQLAGQAGQGAFGRNLAAGQLATQRDLGLGSLAMQQQAQQYNQTVNPTLQLLLAALGMATPTAYQTIVPGKK